MPIAEQARDSPAARLFNQEKFDELLSEYSDRPIAKQAETKVVEKLLQAYKYEDFLAHFPNHPLANIARDSIAAAFERADKSNHPYFDPHMEPPKYVRWNPRADQLYADHNYQLLIEKYPNSSAARKACGELAKSELDSISALKEPQRNSALKALIAKPLYGDTKAVKDACQILAKAEYDRVMLVSDTLRLAALEKFIQNPIFQGTEFAWNAKWEILKLKAAK